MAINTIDHEGGFTTHSDTILGRWNRELYSVVKDFKGVFPAHYEGEYIALETDMVDAGLGVELLDLEGNIEQSSVLTKKGDSLISFGGSTALRITTTGEPASFSRVVL